jgi:hypothetical protein
LTYHGGPVVGPLEPWIEFAGPVQKVGRFNDCPSVIDASRGHGGRKPGRGPARGVESVANTIRVSKKRQEERLGGGQFLGRGREWEVWRGKTRQADSQTYQIGECAPGS